MNGRSSWGLAGEASRRRGIAEVESRALRYGLPAIRWPDPWPSNYLTAMRAATFAFTRGQGREFTQQAFRDAFQRGHDLGVPANVLETAAAAGLDRGEVESAVQDPEIKQRLRAATESAHALGVIGVPTMAIDGGLFWGDDRLEQAAASLRRAPPPA